MDLPEELRNRPARKPGQHPTAMLTLDAYERLKTELDELKSSGREHIADRLRVAREHGDIRENAEYDAAKNEQGLMEARIRQLASCFATPRSSSARRAPKPRRRACSSPSGRWTRTTPRTRSTCSRTLRRSVRRARGRSRRRRR